MKNYKGLIYACLLAVIVLFTACSNEGQADQNGEADEETENGATYEWKLGWNSGLEGDTKGEAAIAFKEYVEAESNGRISIEFFPNETYASSPEMIDAVQLGALEMAIPGANELANIIPQYSALSLPFLVETPEEAYAVLDGAVGEQLKELSQDHGFVALTDVDLGFTQITNNARPINTPEDLRGMSIRSPNDVSLIETFRAFGSSVSTMAYTEIYSGLAQGVIDGQFNPLINIYDQNMQEVQDYLAITNHTYYYCYMIINQDVFNSLDAELQEIVRKGAELARDASRAVVEESDAYYLEKAQEDFVEVTYPDLTLFQEAVQPVYEELESVMGAEIINDIQAFLEQYRN
ncbi:C4-dicarboxylate-binding protein DctP [Evansella vedderi]|uniref:C4-dicarboxylate-binding protein DctP n=1 Tax=Evansella vedderi TaxID=38282 RepID=A0ABT9ZP41_9BACI|nr:TRAP transporter substrate-binding protein [Evansella vedderi]MDQ0252997.1 C4-dicarboxylate-binding protein DctP [Evansella vedderi]